MFGDSQPMEQNRFHATQNRIDRRILDELRETIVRKFVRVANEELNRERRTSATRSYPL